MKTDKVGFWKRMIAACVIGAMVLLLLLSLILGIRTVQLLEQVKTLTADSEKLRAAISDMEAQGAQDPLDLADGDSSLFDGSVSVDAPLKDIPAQPPEENIDSEELEYQKLYPDLKAELVAKSDDNTQKIVYLTFDDGPSDNTKKILDILEEYDAHATFFVSAQFGSKESRSELYNQILESGNMIGLHSYSHDYKEIYSSIDAYLKDMNDLYQEVYETTGFKATMMRFPGGSINSYNGEYFYSLIAEITRRGFTYHDWIVSSGDAEQGTVSAKSIVNAVVDGCENRKKSVVLLHDTDAKGTTVEALPTILKKLKDSGYQFRALDDTVSPYHFGYPDQPK